MCCVNEFSFYDAGIAKEDQEKNKSINSGKKAHNSFEYKCQVHWNSIRDILQIEEEENFPIKILANFELFVCFSYFSHQGSPLLCVCLIFDTK